MRSHNRCTREWSPEPPRAREFRSLDTAAPAAYGALDREHLPLPLFVPLEKCLWEQLGANFREMSLWEQLGANFSPLQTNCRDECRSSTIRDCINEPREAQWKLKSKLTVIAIGAVQQTILLSEVADRVSIRARRSRRAHKQIAHV